MVTIKDVAALSKTSMSTASIVLRGDGDDRKISKATQNQVLQAARELGYRPNGSPVPGSNMYRAWGWI